MGTWFDIPFHGYQNVSDQQLATVTAYPPPVGIESNFVNPENRNRPLYVVTSLLLGIMILFIINRAYTKTFIVRKYSWDDRKSYSLALPKT